MAQDMKRKATLTAILLMAVLIGLFTLAGCGSSKEGLLLLYIDVG